MRLLQRARREWRLFLMAVQFLTRLPVPASVGYHPDLARRAVRHYPLAGILIGSFGASLALIANTFWPPMVAATLAVSGTAWLTVAFHEDGLADTFDALLGVATRQKALSIMKDSRIGSYGGVVLVGSLLLRVAVLAELLSRDPLMAACTLIAAHAAGRSAAVVLMSLLPAAARQDGPAAGASDTVTEVRAADAMRAATSGALMLAVAAWAHPAAVPSGAAAMLFLAGLVVLMRHWLQRRLGGYTGDTLGATEQFGELAVLLAFAGQWTP